MANVKVIPPREKRPETLRVAAYCRVSSDSSDQLHSYATQIRNYTEGTPCPHIFVLADLGLDVVPFEDQRKRHSQHEKRHQSHSYRYDY